MIFDSDVLIWFLRGDSAAERLIVSQPERMASIVSAMELIQGARSHDEVRMIRRFLQKSEIGLIPLTESIGHAAIGLLEVYAQSAGLRAADALIAATAREFGLPLATGNARHFRAIPGLYLRVFRPDAGMTGKRR